MADGKWVMNDEVAYGVASHGNDAAMVRAVKQFMYEYEEGYKRHCVFI